MKFIANKHFLSNDAPFVNISDPFTLSKSKLEAGKRKQCLETFYDFRKTTQQSIASNLAESNKIIACKHTQLRTLPTHCTLYRLGFSHEIQRRRVLHVSSSFSQVKEQPFFHFTCEIAKHGLIYRNNYFVVRCQSLL